MVSTSFLVGTTFGVSTPILKMPWLAARIEIFKSTSLHRMPLLDVS